MKSIRSIIILFITAVSLLSAIKDVKRGKQETCSAEKAQARCVKIVQEWSSFVNSGNLQYLVNNYIQVGASLTVTGAVNTNTCAVVTTDLAQALTADIEAKIKGDVLTIKEVKYLPKSGNVEVHFTSLQGVDATDMSLVDNKWVFKSHCACDYRVSSQTNVFFPCL
jgi:hypothetical protein